MPRRKQEAGSSSCKPSSKRPFAESGFFKLKQAFFKSALRPTPWTLHWLVHLDRSRETKVVDTGVEMLVSLEMMRPSWHSVYAKY